ncbi:MAG: glycosyltransferase family 4 protein [Anaerolineae bacterium]
MQVTLYPNHPAEGSHSMDRYANALQAALQPVIPPGWEVTMPLPPSPWPGIYGQILARLLWYPLWARNQQGSLNHVIDHSYGHLLFALDLERTIVTIHDVAPLRFPGRRLGLSGLAWRWAWRGVQRARHVIVNSTFTAGEARQHLPAAPETLQVIPMAVSSHFQVLPPEKQVGTRHRFCPEGGWLLLHVGHAQPRKNISNLLRALALVRKQGLPATLVQVGGQPTPSQQELVQELALESVVHFVGGCSNQELALLYNAADLFVFPSLYEGFGMPALEAMACGTPVVTSNVTSLPEVVGDAALLADPRSPEAIAGAIVRLLTEPDLAAGLRQRGLARARLFTWQRTAEETLRVYRRVLEESA